MLIVSSSSPLRLSSATTSFPLARIHRLLRPLRSSLAALRDLTATQEARLRASLRLAAEREAGERKIYKERRSGKRQWEDEEFGGRRPTKKRKSKDGGEQAIPAARAGHTINSPANPPLFSNALGQAASRVSATYGSRRFATRSFSRGSIPRSSPSEDEVAVRAKLEKVIEAYSNILEAVYSKAEGPGRSNRVDKLGVMAARVIGQFLEFVVEAEIKAGKDGWYSDESDMGSESKDRDVAEDDDSKTALLDEWYDAVPLLYRRFLLVQHALSLIINTFPAPALVLSENKSKPKPASPSSTSIRHLVSLYDAIHSLHLPYAYRAAAQARLLVPSLVSLALSTPDPSTPLRALHLSYDALSASPELVSFLREALGRDWKRWEDIWPLVAQEPAELIVPGYEAYFSSRSALVAASELQPEEILEELEAFDESHMGKLGSALESLIDICLKPGSADAGKSRLSELSGIVFDAVTSRRNERYGAGRSDPVAALSLAIEAHRLALSLPCLTAPDPLAASPSGSLPGAGARAGTPPPKFKPTRLQALVAISVVNPLASPSSILATAVPMFLSPHSRTRMLAQPPLSSRLPGLEQLLIALTESPRLGLGMKRVAKAVVEELVSRPKRYFADPDPASEEGEKCREWLQGWIEKIEEEEKGEAAGRHGVGSPMPASEGAAASSNWDESDEDDELGEYEDRKVDVSSDCINLVSDEWPGDDDKLSAAMRANTDKHLQSSPQTAFSDLIYRPGLLSSPSQKDGSFREPLGLPSPEPRAAHNRTSTPRGSPRSPPKAPLPLEQPLEPPASTARAPPFALARAGWPNARPPHRPSTRPSAVGFGASRGLSRDRSDAAEDAQAAGDLGTRPPPSLRVPKQRPARPNGKGRRATDPAPARRGSGLAPPRPRRVASGASLPPRFGYFKRSPSPGARARQATPYAWARSSISVRIPPRIPIARAQAADRGDDDEEDDLDPLRCVKRVSA